MLGSGSGLVGVDSVGVGWVEGVGAVVGSVADSVFEVSSSISAACTLVIVTSFSSSTKPLRQQKQMKNRSKPNKTPNFNLFGLFELFLDLRFFCLSILIKCFIFFTTLLYINNFAI